MAAIVLILASFIGGGKALLAVGIAMIIGLPAAYRLARIAQQLREGGFVPASPDNQTIPIPAAQAIIPRVKEAFPRGANSRTIAQYTLEVFETLNARPPGVLASLGLGAIHFGSFVTALLALTIIVVEWNGGFTALIQRQRHQGGFQRVRIVVAHNAANNRRLTSVATSILSVGIEGTRPGHDPLHCIRLWLISRPELLSSPFVSSSSEGFKSDWEGPPEILFGA